VTDSSPNQLGNGYTAFPTVDGLGRTNGWAIYDPAGEYIDTAYNLAGAVEFAKGHAEHRAELQAEPSQVGTGEELGQVDLEHAAEVVQLNDPDVGPLGGLQAAQCALGDADGGGQFLLADPAPGA